MSSRGGRARPAPDHEAHVKAEPPMDSPPPPRTSTSRSRRAGRGRGGSGDAANAPSDAYSLEPIVVQLETFGRTCPEDGEPAAVRTPNVRNPRREAHTGPAVVGYDSRAADVDFDFDAMRLPPAAPRAAFRRSISAERLDVDLARASSSDSASGPTSALLRRRRRAAAPAAVAVSPPVEPEPRKRSSDSISTAEAMKEEEDGDEGGEGGNLDEDDEDFLDPDAEAEGESTGSEGGTGRRSRRGPRKGSWSGSRRCCKRSSTSTSAGSPLSSATKGFSLSVPTLRSDGSEGPFFDLEVTEPPPGDFSVPYYPATARAHQKQPYEKPVSLQSLLPKLRLPLEDAAKDLACSSTTLKKWCRRYGIIRWPWRKIAAFEKRTEEEAAGIVSDRPPPAPAAGLRGRQRAPSVALSDGSEPAAGASTASNASPEAAAKVRALPLPCRPQRRGTRSNSESSFASSHASSPSGCSPLDVSSPVLGQPSFFRPPPCPPGQPPGLLAPTSIPVPLPGSQMPSMLLPPRPPAAPGSAAPPPQQQHHQLRRSSSSSSSPSASPSPRLSMPVAHPPPSNRVEGPFWILTQQASQSANGDVNFELLASPFSFAAAMEQMQLIQPALSPFSSPPDPEPEAGCPLPTQPPAPAAAAAQPPWQAQPPEAQRPPPAAPQMQPQWAAGVQQSPMALAQQQPWQPQPHGPMQPAPPMQPGPQWQAQPQGRAQMQPGPQWQAQPGPEAQQPLRPPMTPWQDQAQQPPLVPAHIQPPVQPGAAWPVKLEPQAQMRPPAFLQPTPPPVQAAWQSQPPMPPAEGPPPALVRAYTRGLPAAAQRQPPVHVELPPAAAPLREAPRVHIKPDPDAAVPLHIRSRRPSRGRGSLRVERWNSPLPPAPPLPFPSPSGLPTPPPLPAAPAAPAPVGCNASVPSPLVGLPMPETELEWLLLAQAAVPPCSPMIDEVQLTSISTPLPPPPEPTSMDFSTLDERP